MRIGLQDMKRSGLFYECYRVLKEVSPKYFLMENVKNLTEKESADVLGDGWTVPVISHIFSFMNF